jgi:hypothetical protein
MSSDSGGYIIPIAKIVCLYIFKFLKECEEQNSEFLLCNQDIKGLKLVHGIGTLIAFQYVLPGAMETNISPISVSCPDVSAHGLMTKSLDRP